MKKFLPLLLCLLLSIFNVARATKPTNTAVPDVKTAHNESMAQDAAVKTLLNDANADEQVTSDDDDSMEVPSSDEGEDMNDDDGVDTPGDKNVASDDAGDDDGGDDDAGDEGE
jgi:hypothetical protein